MRDYWRWFISFWSIGDALVRLMKPEMDAALAKNTDEVQEGIAQNMLKDGTIPIEKIAEFSNLSVERVKELAEKNIA